MADEDIAAHVICRAALLAAAFVLLPAAGHAATSGHCLKERKLETAETPSYTFTFRSLSDAVSPGLYAYMTVTRIDGRSCRALMVLNRHGANLPRPVGLFSTTLSQSDAQALGNAIERVSWASLPTPDKGDVSAASLELEYQKGTQAVRRNFSAANLELLHALSPVMQQLDKLSGTLLASPDRAITVNAARTTYGFKLLIKNVGKGPVMIADPRLPGSTADSTRGVIAVAKAPGKSAGFQPMPTLVPIPLQPAPAGAPPVVLAAGQTLEFDTIQWTAPSRGDYIAEARWIDYDGPNAAKDAVMPMIPDPASGEPDKRSYPIRGAAFSSYLQFAVH